MGVGTPANILEAIERGVDMMDCVMPTRNGRNGMLFTANGIMNMRNKKWADDFSPLQEDGPSFVDPNLALYLWLVGEARRHILAGDFKPWKDEMIQRVTRRL